MLRISFSVIPAKAGIHATHKIGERGIKAKNYIEFLDRFSSAEQDQGSLSFFSYIRELR